MALEILRMRLLSTALCLSLPLTLAGCAQADHIGHPSAEAAAPAGEDANPGRAVILPQTSFSSAEGWREQLVEGVRIRWRPAPDPIPLNQGFDLWVEYDEDETPAERVTMVRVDATMPDHGHGMTRRPEVEILAPGRLHARGLRFHMSGRWELEVAVYRDHHWLRARWTLDLTAKLDPGAVPGTSDGQRRNGGKSSPSPTAVQRAALQLSATERRRILRMSPLPEVPGDPTNAWADDERAARLGQALFFDARLSDDGSIACVTCHDPQQGWADGRRLGRGLEDTPIHVPTLWNVAHQRWFFWDGRADSLWAQALGPLENPLEHGADRLLVAHILYDDRRLADAYEAVFGPLPDLGDEERFPPRGRPVPDDPEHPHARAWAAMAEDDRAAVDRVFASVGKSLAAYERRIVARRAPIDVFVEGLRHDDPQRLAALNRDALRGLQIFVGRGNCHLCHGGPTLSDLEFHDIRLPAGGSTSRSQVGRVGAFRSLLHDRFNGAGVHSDDRAAGHDKIGYLVSGEEMFGSFKTPSLRNVALTAPYMHSGQFASLDEVLQHYSSMPEAGLRRTHHGGARAQESILTALEFTPQETQELLAFLGSLTDAAIDPALTRPPPGLEPPPARPRTRSLDDFIAVSRANLERRPLHDLTGVNRNTEWRLAEQIESALQLAPDPSSMPPALMLAGVRQLQLREARELGRFTGRWLFLPDLEGLAPDALDELLALHPEAELFLDGLTSLRGVQAQRLAAWPGARLSLGGLRTLDVRQAGALAQFTGGLELDGLPFLTPQVAAALGGWHGTAPSSLLSLDGLTSLATESASPLARLEGWGLSLNGLTDLEPGSARALMASGATLMRLNGLARLDAPTVDALIGGTVRFVDLLGLQGLAPTQASRLNGARTVFSLPNSR